MAVQSVMQQATKNPVTTGIKKFNNLINSSIMRTKIHQMVGATDSQEFITSITSAVNTNPALAECDPQTIISAALLGQSLHLKPSPQLGWSLIKTKKRNVQKHNSKLVIKDIFN